jgi:hypothetical protein
LRNDCCILIPANLASPPAAATELLIAQEPLAPPSSSLAPSESGQDVNEGNVEGAFNAVVGGGAPLATSEMTRLAAAESAKVFAASICSHPSEVVDLRTVLGYGQLLHDATRACVVSLTPSEAAAFAERAAALAKSTPAMTMSHPAFSALRKNLPDLTTSWLLFNPLHPKVAGAPCALGDEEFDLCLTAQGLITTLWPVLSVRTRLLARKVAVALTRFRVATRFGRSNSLSVLLARAIDRRARVLKMNSGRCARRKRRTVDELSRLNETLVNVRAHERGVAVMYALGSPPSAVPSPPSALAAGVEHVAAGGGAPSEAD